MKINLTYFCWLLPILILVISLEVVEMKKEGRFAAHKNDLFASLVIGFVAIAISLLLKTFIFFVYSWMYKFRLSTIPLAAWWPWIFCFFADDFSYYWLHRTNHHVRIFWVSHSVHHSIETLTLASGMRVPWTNFITGNFLFWLWMPLVGFNPAMIMTMKSINEIYQFWLHTEKIKKLPAWIEFMFNTPSHHRVHHGCDHDYLDKNLGGTLIIFDRLFGTFVEETHQAVYGLTKKIKSTNPIVIVFEGWKNLFRDLKKSKRLSDYLNHIFNSPGWNSHETAQLPLLQKATEPEKVTVQSIISSPVKTGGILRRRLIKKLTLIFLFGLLLKTATAQPYIDLLNIHYFNSSGKLNYQGNNNYSLTYFNAAATLPIQAGPDNVFVASPFFENWNTSITKNDNTSINCSSVALPLSFIHAFSANWKMLYSVIPRLNYENSSASNIGQLGGAALVIYQKTPALAIKFGAYYNREFFGNFFIPLAGIDWRINSKNALFGVLPGSLTYEHKANAHFYYGLIFHAITNSYRTSGSSYLRIDDNQPGAFGDIYISKNIVFSGELGYSLFRKMRFGQYGSYTADLNMKDSYYVKVTLAYRIRLDKPAKNNGI
jgi:sterol desaturase/sphingolipid hydroxylase (fatty acid hydroxylase superfamily)